jgi:hypothetical protein
MPAALEPWILILCPLAREWSFLVSTFEASIHVERLHHLYQLGEGGERVRRALPLPKRDHLRR